MTVVVDSDRNDATGNRYLTGADMLLSYGITGSKTSPASSRAGAEPGG